MMMKLLVCFALFTACVLADLHAFRPKPLEVASHISVESSEDGNVELYLVTQNLVPLYIKEVFEDDSYDLIRCDLVDDDGKCYWKSFSTDDCDDSDTADVTNFLSSYFPTSFFYEEGPEIVPCPGDQSNQCRKFTLEDIFYFVDSEGRYVGFESGSEFMRYKYNDDVPTVDTFVEPDCDGDALDDPFTFGRVVTNGLPCAFNITIETEGGAEFEMIGFNNPQNNNMLYMMEFYMGIPMMIVRCDVLNDEGLCYAEGYEGIAQQCSSDIPEIDSNMIHYNIPEVFDYMGDPEEFSCGAGASCKAYADILGRYVVLDSNDTLLGFVLSDGSYYYYTYNTDEPAIELVDRVRCNDTALPPVYNPCLSAPSSSSSSSASSTPAGPSSASSTPAGPSSSSAKPVPTSSSAKPQSTSLSSASTAKVAASLVVACVLFILL